MQDSVRDIDRQNLIITVTCGGVKLQLKNEQNRTTFY